MTLWESLALNLVQLNTASSNLFSETSMEKLRFHPVNGFTRSTLWLGEWMCMNRRSRGRRF